ncbi:MAG: twin-arginine translocation signal domain-containing protein, partial [Terriglobia bacterium]
MIDEKDAKEAARGVSRREFIKNAGIATAVWATGYDFLIPGPSLAAQAGDTAEWTYEQAAKVWKPMTRAVQHVGVPGCQWQTGVMWDGALLFGPLDFRYLSVMQDELKLLGSRGASQGDKEVVGNRLHLSVAYGSTMHFADRVGTGKPAIRRRLENGRLPLPYVETTDGDLVWEESVFAHLLGRDFQEGMDPQPDDLPITHAIFKVRNRGSQPQVGHLWLHFADTTQVTLGYKCA